jgi:hypothetical protein
MPDLRFEVEKAEPLPFATAPHLSFALRITNEGAEKAPVHSIALRCQVRIEATQRTYADSEQKQLVELFGRTERWGQTLRSLLWTHAAVTVPPFVDQTVVDLPIACSYDFNIAAVKYFDGLADGDVPLVLLFNGTVFCQDPGMLRLRVEHIPWDREARFRLPVRVWRRMMDLYYPNSAFLSLRKDIFDRLSKYKNRRGLPTWERTLEDLFAAAGESKE